MLKAHGSPAPSPHFISVLNKQNASVIPSSLGFHVVMLFQDLLRPAPQSLKDFVARGSGIGLGLTQR